MRKQFKVTIVTGGLEPDPEVCGPHLDSADRVIAANGGFRVLRALGVTASAVVGDLDSLTEDEVALLERHRIPVRRHPVDKDASDLELALELAQVWGAGEVTILSSLGGRLDHLMFKLIAALCYCREAGMRARVHGRAGEVFLVEPGTRILDRLGWTCSLLALTETVEEVTLTGFQYPLSGERLHRSRSRGLSNRIVEVEAGIETGAGLLVGILLKPECR